MITVKWITTTTCQTRPTWANVHQINYYLSRNFHAGYLPFPYCTFAFSVFTLEKSLLSYWTCLFVILPRMTVAKLHEMYEIYHRSDGWWWAFKYIWFIINIFFQKFTTKITGVMMVGCIGAGRTSSASKQSSIGSSSPY